MIIKEINQIVKTIVIFQIMTLLIEKQKNKIMFHKTNKKNLLIIKKIVYNKMKINHNKL